MFRVPNFIVLAAAIASLFFASTAVHAGVVINLWEDGLDVRGQASGTLDIAGLSFSGNFSFPSDFRIQPNGAEVLFFGPGDLYSGIVSSPNFGSGSIDASGISTGDHFGFEVGNLVVPTGFVSGETIFSEGVFLNTSLAALGADVGNYSYVLPNDTINLEVGQAPTAVPEPSSLLLSTIGIGAITFARKRRNPIGT